jgi:hypothetical protein
VPASPIDMQETTIGGTTERVVVARREDEGVPRGIDRSQRHGASAQPGVRADRQVAAQPIPHPRDLPRRQARIGRPDALVDARREVHTGHRPEARCASDGAPSEQHGHEPERNDHDQHAHDLGSIDDGRGASRFALRPEAAGFEASPDRRHWDGASTFLGRSGPRLVSGWEPW